MLVNDKMWNRLKEDHKENGFGSGLYFSNKDELNDLLNILNQMSEEYSEDFFDDRLLMIGKTSSQSQENKWQVVYSALGKNQEASFFTTVENKLVNVVSLPQSKLIGIDKTLQEEISCGKTSVTPYEEEFLNDSVSDLEEAKIKVREL